MQTLREEVTAKAGRVDADAGVIFGVKVIGVTSSNGRHYSPQVLARAAPLYEGVSVRLDHPGRPDDMRSANDVLGSLRNVRQAPDGGLVADLHLLLSHPFAARLLEAARVSPGLFGLSHNSEGETEFGPDGVEVVRQITAVRSVDVVADPATTKSLFESHGHGDPFADDTDAFVRALGVVPGPRGRFG